MQSRSRTKKDTKQFPVTAGPKIRVGSMAGCCVRYWYDLYAHDRLPECGEMACPECSAIIKRDGANWWKGTEKDTIA